MALTRNRLIGNLANATDSAASSSFLAKGATEANYQSIAYSDVTGKPTILDSAGITSIIDSSYVQARQGSAVAGLDSAGITSVIDSNYVVARAAASGSGYGRYNYTATAGQTVFQDSDNSGAVLSYTSGGIMVFYNGVMLKNTADWEGTDGSSVTLVEAADSGANVSIHKWTVAGGGSGGGSNSIFGTRGLDISGTTADASNAEIQYFDITTQGNASSFGDMASSNRALAAVSNGSTAFVGGGLDNTSLNQANTIEYFGISTLGNASDYGDLTVARGYCAAAGNLSYGVWAGGLQMASPNLQSINTIDYVTLGTPGNASDFGDLTVGRDYIMSTGNLTYAVFGAGENSSGTDLNTIDYVTIDTPSNATDFGDLTTVRYGGGIGVMASSTVGIFAGGYADGVGNSNVIDYVIIATPGNATDFGDLAVGENSFSQTGDGTTGTFMGGSSWDQDDITYITIASPGNAASFGSLNTSLYNSTGSGASGSPS